MIEVLSRLWLLLTALWVVFVLFVTLLVLSGGGRFDLGIFSIALLGLPLIVLAIGAASCGLLVGSDRSERQRLEPWFDRLKRTGTRRPCPSPAARCSA
jgi:hypothetical protein